MGTETKIQTILISPLDWGLGHATRCIPVIQYFIDRNVRVIIACEKHSAVEALLVQEFPSLTMAYLPGYHVSYPQNGKYFAWKMLAQLPKILRAATREHRWLRTFLKKNQVDLVISDNRFGFFSSKVKSIFMTHQLEIAAPAKWLRSFICQINYWWIKHFAGCWVVDFEQAPGLAGSLSHPAILPPIPVHYLGLLQRLGTPPKAASVHFEFQFLILLSGPEPQRTILEKKWMDMVARLPEYSFCFVLGQPMADVKAYPHIPNCTIFSHLNSQQLRTYFNKAQYIISRTGYTTVMEIMSWQKPSILIPTPGQTEQELLGKILAAQGLAYVFDQNAKDYPQEIRNAMSFAFQQKKLPYSDLEKNITRALSALGCTTDGVI